VCTRGGDEAQGAGGAGVDSGRSAPSLPERSTDGAHASGIIPVDTLVEEEERMWRPCSARSACKRSHRRSYCPGSDSDEPGLSAWRERFEAMLRAMRAVRRRSAVVRGLVDAGDDVGRVAPKGEMEDGCL
jgi:hypothetical protein